MRLQDWFAKMPEHFENPLLEQRKLLAGEAYVERDDQSVVRVSGEDAKSWLHSLLTQDILNLGEGESTEALLLTPQGHIEHQLKVVISEGGVLLIVDSTRADSLISWLEKMRFRTKVEISKSPLKTYGLFVKVPGLLWHDSFSIPSSFRQLQPDPTSVQLLRASFRSGSELGTSGTDGSARTANSCGQTRDF